MNLKNSSILTIISISSLGLLCSCSYDELVKKPATFSGSYKLVAISCGKIQSEFDPEGYFLNENSTSNSFEPIGFSFFDPPTNRDFKIKHENDKYSFVYTIENSFLYSAEGYPVKCSYTQELLGSVSDTNNIKLVIKSKILPITITSNDNECPELNFSPFYRYKLEGKYEFEQNKNLFTLTSKTNDYCKEINSNWDEKLILTLVKE